MNIKNIFLTTIIGSMMTMPTMAGTIIKGRQNTAAVLPWQKSIQTDAIS